MKQKENESPFAAFTAADLSASVLEAEIFLYFPDGESV